MLRKKKESQEQKAENGSVAIQAGRDVSIIGISYSDAKQIALDVFNENFLKLSCKAREIADARAETITDKFLSRLQTEYPEGIRKAEDPDFQYALFSVQKEYARSGDENMGDLLVDILVDRSKQEQRNILQIVLNESLLTAPKLTEAQLAALSLIYILRYTQSPGVVDDQKLGELFDKRVFPFIGNIVKNDACYQHLQYCGCGSVATGQLILENIISGTYQRLFLKGFTTQEIIDRNIDIEINKDFFITCLNDDSKMQVNALNKEALQKKFEDKNTIPTDREKINQLFELNKMSNQEIKDKCITIRNYMSSLFDVWNDSQMKHFILTSVGIAIGHANLRRFSNEQIDLNIWIN